MRVSFHPDFSSDIRVFCPVRLYRRRTVFRFGYPQPIGSTDLAFPIPRVLTRLDQKGASVGRYQISGEFNLVKFRTDELKIAFLAYPEFATDAHPALRHAISVDPVNRKALTRAEAGRVKCFVPAGL